jgi:peptidoglycan/LPS O-acetylase OafA/YrhL
LKDEIEQEKKQAAIADKRIFYLDGLRGLAAFIVLVSHVIVAFYPALYFGAEGRAGFQFEDWLSKSPLFVVYSGTFAVFVFFVLSGFVIASSSQRTRQSFLLLSVRRFLRLFSPSLASVIFAYLLINFVGLPELGMSAHWWVKQYYQQPVPGPLGALTDSIMAFVRGSSYFNGVLWTMRTELAGSIMIYFVYRLTPAEWRRLCLAGCAFVLCIVGLLFGVRQTFTISLMAFALGALVFEQRLPLSEIALSRSWILIGVGLFLGGYSYGPPGPSYAVFDLFGSASFALVRVAGAVCLIAGMLTNLTVQRFFQRMIFQFLGRISFALYLLHLPLLLTAMLLVALHPPYQAIPAWMIAIPYTLLVLLLAYAFTRLFDEPLVRWLSSVRFSRAMTYRKMVSFRH